MKGRGRNGLRLHLQFGEIEKLLEGLIKREREKAEWVKGIFKGIKNEM